MRRCAFQGCKRPAKAKGYCGPCYKREIWRPANGPGRQREIVRERERKHQEAYRANERDYVRRLDKRGVCEDCGGAMGISVFHDGICKRCQTKRKEANYRAVELMWEDGLKFPEIMEAMGWSRGRLAVESDRMRKEGWNLPHRYNVKNGKRLAA